MAHIALDIKCPGCGGAVTTADKECKFCGRPVLISTFSSVYSMPVGDVNKYASTYKGLLEANPNDSELNNSIAMCYLKLGLYDKALLAFEKAIESNFDNSETYFYCAVCLLKGKKAFLSTRPMIDKIICYIEAAVAIEPKSIYYYFFAYIKYDYFARKHFITSPTYEELMETAQEVGLSDFDIEQLYCILKVEKPECL